MHLDRSRLYYASGICLLGLVLLLHLMTIERQAPWEDEIFVVSTALSVARYQPPIMSVMSQYPRTDSPIAFYGPVSFETEALLIRAFGLSVSVWRFVCFAGLLFTLWLASGLVGLAGGDKWARLTVALILAFAGSIATQQPGRWDFPAVACFLGGLLLLLRGVEAGGKILFWRAAAAGGFIGLALASTPRVLTLCLAAAVSLLGSALCFARIRRKLLLGTLVAFVVGVLMQTLLLLPWGLNSFSWYVYVKQATKLDYRNATPLTGLVPWGLDLQIHKTFFLLLPCLLLIGALGAAVHRETLSKDERLPFKVSLCLFAVINISLALSLLGRALGQSAFWLPPIAIAALCWSERTYFQGRRQGGFAMAIISACLLILFLQEFRQMSAIILTWDRRSINDVTVFVERTLPKNAVVYGPIDGEFYPVELAGDRYLYLYAEGRFVLPWLPSHPDAPVSQKVDEEICAYPTYAIWPEPDPVRYPGIGAPPEVLRDRLQAKVGELRQAPLSPWVITVLSRLGAVGGKYGFPDMAIYSLRGLSRCGKA